MSSDRPGIDRISMTILSLNGKPNLSVIPMSESLLRHFGLTLVRDIGAMKQLLSLVSERSAWVLGWSNNCPRFMQNCVADFSVNKVCVWRRTSVVPSVLFERAFDDMGVNPCVLGKTGSHDFNLESWWYSKKALEFSLYSGSQSCSGIRVRLPTFWVIEGTVTLGKRMGKGKETTQE